LEEEKESLGCHPGDQEEGASRDSEHRERAEMVVVSLSTQRAFFFHYVLWGFEILVEEINRA
jgi:hypothetical protein